jgi:hypothetical protein
VSNAEYRAKIETKQLLAARHGLELLVVEENDLEDLERPFRPLAAAQSRVRHPAVGMYLTYASEQKFIREQSMLSWRSPGTSSPMSRSLGPTPRPEPRQGV